MIKWYSDIDEQNKELDNDLSNEKDERKVQKAILEIKNKYGKKRVWTY